MQGHFLMKNSYLKIMQSGSDTELGTRLVCVLFLDEEESLKPTSSLTYSHFMSVPGSSNQQEFALPCLMELF